MIKSNLFEKSASRNFTEQKGAYSVLEYERDLSIAPEMAQMAYFASEMNVRKRQLIVDINDDNGVVIQAGSMQLMLGSIEVSTNIKGAGDLFKKVIGSTVTDERAIKPHYYGRGQVVLEPTFNHILLEEVSEWGDGMVIEDGMFLACDDTVEYKVTARTTISSAILGGEGLFNTTLYGNGIVAMESPVPADEIIVVDLEDDIIRIDGSMAIAWSTTLKFTVEKSTKTLIGSAVSGEGFVNVYEGTGRVMIAPVRVNRGISAPDRAN